MGEGAVEGRWRMIGRGGEGGGYWWNIVGMLQNAFRLISLLFSRVVRWLEELELRQALRLWLRAWQNKNEQWKTMVLKS